jgi:hypothetical protein
MLSIEHTGKYLGKRLWRLVCLRHSENNSQGFSNEHVDINFESIHAQRRNALVCQEIS